MGIFSNGLYPRYILSGRTLLVSPDLMNMPQMSAHMHSVACSVYETMWWGMQWL